MDNLSSQHLWNFHVCSSCIKIWISSIKSDSTLRRHLVRVKPPTEKNQTKNCIYSIPCSCSKVYKGETCRPLKVRVEEHRKAVTTGETEKSGIAYHVWKEKGDHRPLWDEVKIINSEPHWKVRKLKETAHMLGHNNLLSRPSIELNTIWEPLIFVLSAYFLSWY